MKNTYCTFFNHAYLARGLTLYRSMERCIQSFHLYILAMDRMTRDVLNDLDLKSATILYYEDLMDDALRKALSNRIGPSFYWTFTPVVIEHVIKEKKEDWCTYVDADCFFLKDPGFVFDVMEEQGNCVGIVEQRFRKDESYKELVRTNGRFNVAFNTFRNTEESLKVLADWKSKCIGCCSATTGEESFGDQLYLNEWPDQFEGIYIVDDEGIDVAPWNVSNYSVAKKDGAYVVRKQGYESEIKMYHFHAFSFLSSRIVSLNLWHPKRRMENSFLFEMYQEYLVRYKEQQEIANRYLRYNAVKEPSKSSFSKKIGTLIKKYKERPDKSIINFLRNVIIVK